MPFPDVGGKNFEQVLNGLIHFVKPLVIAAHAEGDFNGWPVEKYFAALESMVGQSSDRLWSAAIDDQGQSKADALKPRVDALELIVSRQDEQLASLQNKP